MMNFIDGKLLRLKFWAKREMEQLIKKEDGDTNFVSMIVIIVIIMALAVVFREALTTAMTTVIGRFTDFVGE